MFHCRARPGLSCGVTETNDQISGRHYELKLCCTALGLVVRLLTWTVQAISWVHETAFLNAELCNAELVHEYLASRVSHFPLLLISFGNVFGEQTEEWPIGIAPVCQNDLISVIFICVSFDSLETLHSLASLFLLHFPFLGMQMSMYQRLRAIRQSLFVYRKKTEGKRL